MRGGDNVGIGGFIITGPDMKKVIIRAIGPALGGAGVANALQDPTLELHGSNGALLASIDNWKDTQPVEIQSTTIPPTDDRESAIVQTLSPGSYTAIVRGKGTAVGVALIETYDLATSANSALANISTRGFVEPGDNAMIGGLSSEAAPAVRKSWRGESGRRWPVCQMRWLIQLWNCTARMARCLGITTTGRSHSRAICKPLGSRRQTTRSQLSSPLCPRRAIPRSCAARITPAAWPWWSFIT